MNVAAAAPGCSSALFRTEYNHWPVEHFDEVCAVSTTFAATDPRLGSPLLTPYARSEVLCKHSGHCLNFNGTNHSMRSC